MSRRLAIALTGAAAALALSAAPAAMAAPKAQSASHAVKRAHAHSPNHHARAKPHAAIPEVQRSDDANRLINWITTSQDNGSLPYAVIDKQAAMLFLFNSSGEQLGSAPVLIGISPGDDSSPGVGSKVLAEIGPAEKTTPAGRFLAKFGLAAKGERVLWVDYADSVAMHAVITTNPKEHRLQRLSSPNPEDHRISFGCINLPTKFYQQKIRPLFQDEGGFVYILPDTKPVEVVFPRLLTMPATLAGGDTEREMHPTPIPEPPPAN